MSSRHGRKLTFHYIGNVHLPVALQYNACAFTQKIHKLCEMLMNQGHRVILYGAEGTDAPCSEMVVTHPLAEIKDAFGDKPCTTDDPLGYEWKTADGGFRHDFDSKLHISKRFNETCILEINKRKQADHFLLLSMGHYQKPIADAVGLYLTCEPGIGYRGSFAPFRAFESCYIQNFMYGSEHPLASLDGQNYDRVIPNYYRPEDFVVPPLEGSTLEEGASDHLDRDKTYLLFMGRLIHRKGISVAISACKATGTRLLITGQGYKSWDPQTKTLVDQDGGVHVLADNMEFLGYADAEQRRKLMNGATAVICPSLYMEPFCGVNVEAQLCGTPVITTDFGAFPETVEQGRTGFRCLVMQDYVDAIRRVGFLDRAYIQERALRLYSCEAVGKEFERWFQDLYNLWESAHLDGVKGWSRVE